MILELTATEVVALRLAAEESLESYVEMWPIKRLRPPPVQARITTLQELHERLASEEIDLALAGTPPDLRSGATM